VVSNTADYQYGYNSVPFAGTGKVVDSSLMPSPASTPVLYYIELAKYYNNESELLVAEVSFRYQRLEQDLRRHICFVRILDRMNPPRL
jgi:hypothetical protein